MEDQQLFLQWKNHQTSFIHAISLMYEKNSYCDVTLACEGKFYPSHKFVLSTCSEYFQEMFQHTQCKHPVIVLKDIHCEDLEALLNYMYLGEVHILEEKLSTLIKAADCLKIKDLAEPGVSFKKVHHKKRGKEHHDSACESKRRRTESEQNRERDVLGTFPSHLLKMSKTPHKENVTVKDKNFDLFSKKSKSDVDSEYFIRFDAGSEFSRNALKNQIQDEILIKVEKDEAVDIEESIAGTEEALLSPLIQEEISVTEITDSTQAHKVWGSDSGLMDGCSSPLEGDESCGSTNEEVLEKERFPDYVVVQFPKEDDTDNGSKTISEENKESVPLSLHSTNITSLKTSGAFERLVLLQIEKLKTALKEAHGTQQKLIGKVDHLVKNNEFSTCSLKLPDNLKFPLESDDHLASLELKLEDSAFEELLINNLGTIGGSNPKETTRRILRHTLTNALAKKYNWKGKGEKKAFSSLKMNGIIHRAVRENRLTTKASDMEIEKEIKEWLKFAPDRDGGRKEREERRKKL